MMSNDLHHQSSFIVRIRSFHGHVMLVFSMSTREPVTTAACSQGSEDLHHAVIEGGAPKHAEPLHANVRVAQRRKEGLEPQCEP